MGQRIRIWIGGAPLEAELNESRTAKAVWAALPLQAMGSRWGKEIYFAIPVKTEEEDPHEIVSPGTLAYWPLGNAFCIFWGPTPASHADECRPYSPVNVFGRLLEDPKVMDSVSDLKIRVERA